MPSGWLIEARYAFGSSNRQELAAHNTSAWLTAVLFVDVDRAMELVICDIDAFSPVLLTLVDFDDTDTAMLDACRAVQITAVEFD